MTLEGLLSFFTILVAIMALVDPVQRLSLSFIAPWRWLFGAAAVSAVLLLVRDALRVGGLGEATDGTLSSLSFVIPAAAGFVCIRTWQRAKLPREPDRALHAVYQLVRAALLEDRFTEVERVLRANQVRLRKLTDEHTVLLFDPRLVSAFLASGSSFHLELLADLAYVESLPNQFATVHGVVRALLVGEMSPLRSVIVETTSAQERYHATAGETALVDQTFGNPKWYLRSLAYYALTVAAVQEVDSGDRDVAYNGPLGLYGATQGRSTRARCPIFLSEKTIVFALNRAIALNVPDDCYVIDLFDLYRNILAHSDYRSSVWDRPFAESPTPFAYLLTEITNDLRKLALNSIQGTTGESDPEPGHIDREIALTWSFCVWSIADPQTRVSQAFRMERIKDYLRFVFELGWQTAPRRLDRWRDLFADELSGRLKGTGESRESVLSALDQFEPGKDHIQLGRGWLRSRL
jgi:hypothetical protein